MLDFTPEQPEPPPVGGAVPEAIDNLDREALQKRVRDHAASNASSFKSIGLVAGIAESTFTAWLNNKYKGDNEKIDGQVRVWLKSEAQLTRRRIMLPAEQKFVQTRSAAKFIGAMEFARRCRISA